MTTITFGQTSSGLVVSSGGFLIVQAGGTVVSTTVQSSGMEAVFGKDIDGTVYNGGFLNISTGGVASGLNISGGSANLTSGTAINTIVGAGGYFGDGGTTTGTVVQSGGYDFISEEAKSTFLTVQSGGVAVAFGATVINPIISGGSLDLSFGAVASGIIQFGSEAGGELELDHSGGQGATISDFTQGDTIQNYADQVFPRQRAVQQSDVGLSPAL